MSDCVHPGGVVGGGGIEAFVSAWQDEDPQVDVEPQRDAYGRDGLACTECGWLCVDWLVRAHAATWLDVAARKEGRALWALPPIADEHILSVAGDVLSAACAELDLAVSRTTRADRTRWDAARAAAWDGPWWAAWECANAVVLAVADCPRESAIRLAKEAARDSAFIVACGDELSPTQQGLRRSALTLLAQMAGRSDHPSDVSARSRAVLAA